MEEILSLKWNNHVTSFLHVLKSLRNEENYADVTLACDGKFYDVHKLVLSMCSDYFKEIFLRSAPRTQIFIVLKDVKSSDLELLLDYMYLGEISVKQMQLASLIKAAECLRIKGLAVPENMDVEDSTSSKGPLKAADSTHQTEQNKIPPNSNRNILEALLSPLKPHTIFDTDDSLHLPIDSLKSEAVLPKPEPTSNEEQMDEVNNHQDFSPLKNFFQNSQSMDFGSQQYSMEEENAAYSPLSSRSQNSMSIKSWHRNSTDGPLLGDSFDITPTKDLPHIGLSGTVEMKKFLPRHQCTYCGKYFPSNAHLTRHIRIHTGEKPFHCPVCPYKANQKNSVVKHVKMRHMPLEENH